MRLSAKVAEVIGFPTCPGAPGLLFFFDFATPGPVLLRRDEIRLKKIDTLGQTSPQVINSITFHPLPSSNLNDNEAL
jgi:hypothetical protein